jgi:hypothetical protein
MHSGDAGRMMDGQVCPFHGDEWDRGTPLPDGSRSYRCELRRGHPGGGIWSWLVLPPPPAEPGITGTAEELDLATELPEALAILGFGWFEYGLVERSYARRRPEDFQQMVKRWGHTAIAPKQYTASSYIARTLGSLSSMGRIAYHGGRGTGRWSYNSDISYWCLLPPADWNERTAWVDIIGDQSPTAQEADVVCRSYVTPGPTR